MTANESPASIATPLHIVAFWESDGFDTFETGRARLLDVLAQVVETTPLRLMIGTTAFLGDIAAVRSDLLALLVIYNASGRLSLGPWFVQPDEWLISGESLIRNLSIARADAARYGINLMPLGYAPEAPGHTAQLPQILRGFDMDAAFVGRGAPTPRLPFRWEAPDGSRVLAINELPGIHKSLELAGQKAIDPDGPWLVMHAFGVKRDAATPPVPYSTLKTYIEALRQGLPDHLRPALGGELRAPSDDLRAGTLSSRLYLKQANARLQTRLTAAAEPWLALALTHGSPVNPDNLRALLDHSWRMLLRNQALSAIGGTSSAAAHDEHEIRSRQVEDTTAHVMQASLRALFGEPYHAGTETNIVVWNPHNWRVEQVVEVPFQPPNGHFPAHLLDPDGSDKPFTWANGTLAFAAAVPPVGYAAYTLHLAPQQRDDIVPVRSRATSIASALGDHKLLVDNERLIWQQVQPAVVDKDGQLVSQSVNLTDVLRFYDGGDAGDVYNYRAPSVDVVVSANLLTDIEVESTPIYQRLSVHHRLRIAPALQPDRTRARGLKSLDLVTQATFYPNDDGLFFRTTFENTADDHRLRVHLRTGLKAESVWADAPFHLMQRSTQRGTQPMQNLCAVENGTQVMALLARGLPEYEAINEYGQVTLALTLLRAVSGAQSRRPLTADYALLSLPDASGLLHTAQTYSAPLQTYLSAQRPVKPTQSYLTLDDENVILTALKPPQTGAGWIVRLFNPTNDPISTNLHVLKSIKAAHMVNLAEEAKHALEAHAGELSIKIDPQQILTLRLEF